MESEAKQMAGQADHSSSVNWHLKTGDIVMGVESNKDLDTKSKNSKDCSSSIVQHKSTRNVKIGQRRTEIRLKNNDQSNKPNTLIIKQRIVYNSAEDTSKQKRTPKERNAINYSVKHETSPDVKPVSNYQELSGTPVGVYKFKPAADKKFLYNTGRSGVHPVLLVSNIHASESTRQNVSSSEKKLLSLIHGKHSLKRKVSSMPEQPVSCVDMSLPPSSKDEVCSTQKQDVSHIKSAHSLKRKVSSMPEQPVSCVDMSLPPSSKDEVCSTQKQDVSHIKSAHSLKRKVSSLSEQPVSCVDMSPSPSSKEEVCFTQEKPITIVTSAQEKKAVYTKDGHENLKFKEKGKIKDNSKDSTQEEVSHAVVKKGDDIKDLTCHVCGDTASFAGLKCGKMACKSCMAFFITCQQYQELLVCMNNFTCDLTGQNRSKCRACRLKKCSEVGFLVRLLEQRNQTDSGEHGQEETLKIKKLKLENFYQDIWRRSMKPRNEPKVSEPCRSSTKQMMLKFLKQKTSNNSDCDMVSQQSSELTCVSTYSVANSSDSKTITPQTTMQTTNHPILREVLGQYAPQAHTFLPNNSAEVRNEKDFIDSAVSLAEQNHVCSKEECSKSNESLPVENVIKVKLERVNGEVSLKLEDFSENIQSQLAKGKLATEETSGKSKECLALTHSIEALLAENTNLTKVKTDHDWEYNVKVNGIRGNECFQDKTVVRIKEECPDNGYLMSATKDQDDFVDGDVGFKIEIVYD